MFLGFFGLIVIFGIIEHGRAQTVLSFLAHEDVVVDTALASGPELFILCELRVGHRLITQVAVDFHHGKTGSQSEDLGIGIFFSAQLKNSLLDGLGNSAFSVFWWN